MLVTQIEPFTRGKGREAIYINNQFAFVLYKGELVKYDIVVGSEIDETQYNEVLQEVLIPRAKKRGLNLLMKMDRTESDVRHKLSDSGYPIEAIDVCIEYLKSFHYIDDYRYASDYIRFKSSSMSRKQMANKLAEKGVDKSIIDNALLEFYSDGDTTAEAELIRKLINKRLHGQITELDYNDKQKLFAYLYNKGFNISDVEKIYADMLLDIT